MIYYYYYIFAKTPFVTVLLSRNIWEAVRECFLIFCIYYVFTRTPFSLYFCPETKVPKVLRSKGEMARANGNKLLTVKF